MTWKPATATISASAACLTKFVADNIQSLEISRRSRPRVVLADDPPKCDRFGEKILRACNNLQRDIDRIGSHKLSRQKNPRGPLATGISSVSSEQLLFQDHRRERIDIGLQAHQHANKPCQHDPWHEHATPDRTPA